MFLGTQFLPLLNIPIVVAACHINAQSEEMRCRMPKNCVYF